jgi:hypothetical protein
MRQASTKRRTAHARRFKSEGRGMKLAAQLSNSEMRFLSRINARERSWRIYRWVGLIASLSPLSAGLWVMFFGVSPSLQENAALKNLVPLCYLTSFVLFVLGFALLCYICTHWAGNLRDQILLKIVQSVNSPSNGTQQTGSQGLKTGESDLNA